jgi:Zn-dependent protease with chaperone function
VPRVDLDFQRYIERRRGAHQAQTREGAAYAHPGDLRYLRTLEGLRPVRLALEAAGRLWATSARDALLATAARATLKRDESLFVAVARCAQALHIAAPPAFVVPPAPGAKNDQARAEAFGSNEDPIAVFGRATLDALGEPELLFAAGRVCGHVQNNHVSFATARHYLAHDASTFVRWSVAPARAALNAWWKRAELTADRAGLLCVRDLDAACAALAKLAPEQPKRIEELRAWAAEPFYRAIVEAAKS